MNPVYHQTPKIDPLFNDARKLPPYTVVNEPPIITSRIASGVSPNELEKLKSSIANAVDEDYQPFPGRVAKVLTANTTVPRKVVADDYDDLNIDWVPEHTTPVNNVVASPEVIAPHTVTEVLPSQGEFNFDGDEYGGKPYNAFNQEPTGIPQQLQQQNAQNHERPIDLSVATGIVQNQPLIPGIYGIKSDYNLWDAIRTGWHNGFSYSLNAGERDDRSLSAAIHRAPETEYNYLPPVGQATFAAGRIAGDVVGYGTKQALWRMQPPDISSTYSGNLFKKLGGSRLATIAGPFAVTSALELGSNIYNPFNLGQGGRPQGFAAINADQDDSRVSTTPVSEMIIDRGFFGRRGKVLPWEQFHQERPDISYDHYSKYKDYLYNKDDNLLRNATLGLAKGTMDGLNGPELSLAGFSVTPLGVAGALGTTAAVAEGIKRFAVLRK